MPELPEVEVTRRSLAGRLPGARILQAWMGKPLRWPLGLDPAHLVGLELGEIARRGKYLWFAMARPVDARAAAGAAQGRAQGSAQGSAQGPAHDAAEIPRQSPHRNSPQAPSQGGLLLHLGMSGSLGLFEAPGERGAHDHFELLTTRGCLRLRDPRRFGAVVWSDALDCDPAARLLARLGPEPFDAALTPQSFHAALQRRASPIKQVLLGGEAVVGAGNIYACEALFQAGIDPRLPADAISRPRAARLLAAVRATLSQALELGGSTLRDFSDAHGVGGAFQTFAAVYDREGQPCGRCAAPVRRLVQGQRATYFCGQCQRR